MSSSIPEFPPVKACLFDMDGLLINTEDLYSLVTNLVLAKYGKPELPWSIKAQLQGRPGPEATRIFLEWAQIPLTVDGYQEEARTLQQQYFPTCSPLPGSAALLKSLQSAGVELALATSSQKYNFYLKTDHLRDFMEAFSESRRVLGDDPRVPKGRGKPAPDIYQVALETINADLRKDGKKPIEPHECLVFEDSVPGVEAGRRAGMRVVWVPHAELLAEFKGKEGAVLAGLTSEDGKGNAEVEATGLSPEKVGAGWPGQVDDGWGERLDTLKDFDYQKYNIIPRVSSK